MGIEDHARPIMSPSYVTIGSEIVFSLAAVVVIRSWSFGSHKSNPRLTRQVFEYGRDLCRDRLSYLHDPIMIGLRKMFAPLTRDSEGCKGVLLGGPGCLKKRGLLDKEVQEILVCSIHQLWLSMKLATEGLQV